MGQHTHILVLLAAVLLRVVTSRTVIQPGGTFRRSCPLTVQNLTPENSIVQFFRDRTESSMFDSKSSTTTLKVLSNDSEVDPLITAMTDRYSVTKTAMGPYVLEITNLTDADSGWYGCQIFSKLTGSADFSLESSELQVPGPLQGLFWTKNYTAHLLHPEDSDQYKIESGSNVILNNNWHDSLLACVVLVSNVEPHVNITKGQPDEKDSVDMTGMFRTLISSETTIFNAGIRYRNTVFFIKNKKFQGTSIKDLLCTASLYGATFESAFNVQIRSKPPIGNCVPHRFYAEEGDRNVNVSCLIPAHPYAKVNWITPNDGKVNESSPLQGYTVTNKEQFDGVLSTLTIAEVATFNGQLYQVFQLEAVNSEGRGEMYLFLYEGDRTSSGIHVSRVGSIHVLAILGVLLWVIQ